MFQLSFLIIYHHIFSFLFNSSLIIHYFLICQFYSKMIRLYLFIQYLLSGSQIKTDFLLIKPISLLISYYFYLLIIYASLVIFNQMSIYQDHQAKPF